MSVIVIFDDKDSEREELAEAVDSACEGSAEIVEFLGDSAPEHGESFETHITAWIDSALTGKSLGLIVCDKELGSYANLTGFSATAVASAAMQRGLPFCQFSRQAADDEREFERFKRLRQWSSSEITLDGLEPKDWAPQVGSLFAGFEFLRAEYDNVAPTQNTPAAALAAILRKPESESRIALYGSGEQAFLKEILTFYDPDQPDMDALQKRMPRILGNWLLLSILRFPGILVNLLAAASYLNVDPKAFLQEGVQQLFDRARYTGPFCELELGPWWWRSELDALLGEAGWDDGRAYCDKAGATVGPCLDPHSGERAGYYCMLTRAPVSASNSCGDISWFPSGADLARIRKDKFEQITALVGMF